MATNLRAVLGAIDIPRRYTQQMTQNVDLKQTESRLIVSIVCLKHLIKNLLINLAIFAVFKS